MRIKLQELEAGLKIAINCQLTMLEKCKKKPFWNELSPDWLLALRKKTANWENHFFCVPT